MGFVGVDRVEGEREYERKGDGRMQTVLWVNNKLIWGDIQNWELRFDVRIGVPILPVNKKRGRKVKNSKQILWKEKQIRWSNSFVDGKIRRARPQKLIRNTDRLLTKTLEYYAIAKRQTHQRIQIFHQVQHPTIF